MTTVRDSGTSSPTVADRRAVGRAVRAHTPRRAHAELAAGGDTRDAVGLIVGQNATRDPDLVPVRHGRMMASPFTFYRGAARVMADDLSRTPTTGLTVQLCGDAHLSNFGFFGSPERSLLFDVNDFDETLPGPFEWDVKRLAASITVAARNNGHSESDAAAATGRSVRAYREAMRGFAQWRTLDLWYARMSEDDVRAGFARLRSQGLGKGVRRADRALSKAHTRDSMQALERYVEVVDGRQRIVSDPPVIIPFRELHEVYGQAPSEAQDLLQSSYAAYRETLTAERRQLLERFTFVDLARKVVGVGSVGTRSWMALFQGRDDSDPLFLQAKEATSSVLEGYLPKSRYRHPGRRVVEGQRRMQAASDIFLGWSDGLQDGRYYYWRQLRDMKASAEVERFQPAGLAFYGDICGWTLARAHARSGDPVAIAAYLGKGDAFDEAVGSFARRYADVNESDYAAFVAAVVEGRIEAVEGV